MEDDAQLLDLIDALRDKLDEYENEVSCWRQAGAYVVLSGIAVVDWELLKKYVLGM